MIKQFLFSFFFSVFISTIINTFISRAISNWDLDLIYIFAKIRNFQYRKLNYWCISIPQHSICPLLYKIRGSGVWRYSCSHVEYQGNWFMKRVCFQLDMPWLYWHRQGGIYKFLRFGHKLDISTGLMYLYLFCWLSICLHNRAKVRQRIFLRIKFVFDRRSNIGIFYWPSWNHPHIETYRWT